MILLEVVLHLFECVKRIEHVVLENSVEFMFKTSENGSGLKRINTLLLKRSGPVEGIQIKKLEVIEHKHHAGYDLRFIEALISNLQVHASGSN